MFFNDLHKPGRAVSGFHVAVRVGAGRLMSLRMEEACMHEQNPLTGKKL